MEMKTYKVIAERGKKFWILEAPEAGTITQVTHLGVAEEWIREAISMMLDVPEDSFDVDIEVELPVDQLAELRAIKDRHREAVRLQQETAARSRALVSELACSGITHRDIGRILGVSQQRVSQLAA
ncbi:MAG: hypothetical protein ACRDPW_11440 [Mycobacteriales bacterium]